MQLTNNPWWEVGVLKFRVRGGAKKNRSGGDMGQGTYFG
jgi:hypothetical protein